MGAWAEDSFANDTALDWVAELNETDDLTFVEETLSVAAEAEDYPGAEESSTAIAAAEVVAALLGKPMADLPDEVIEYVARIKEKPPTDLVQLASETVERIKAKSELQELWAESGDPGAWLKAMTDLEERLR
ncbi:MAG: hypothetical protein JWO94_2024 [Verrucomicrobiaceae bacterium]|nr:hypothetical protein [Verrucomicrobiaceae bacterium]